MQHFSTDTVAPSQRYSYWKEAVCSTFVPLDVRCDKRLPFRSELYVRPAAAFDLITGDTIVYAVCPAQFIKIAKAVIDTVGHYSRPDIFTLSVHPRGGAAFTSLARQAVESIHRGGLDRIADRHEVGVSAIEAAVVAGA